MEPKNESGGLCECCGTSTRSVWGFIYLNEIATAAYFVNWTLGAVDTHGAMFDFILGKWGEDATEADRVAACLEFQAGTGFIVRDSADRPAASSDLTERALRREEIIDTPLAQQLFDLVDAVWLQDDRIAEIREAQAKSR